MDSKPTSTWVINTSEATFEQDVFDRSQDTLVVLDFWATWCQPCRLLSPALEQLAEEYGGRFLLVKAETEQVPRAATQFRVQSIPAVFAISRGQVLDHFAGLLPPDQLRVWIDRALGHVQLAEAQQLETTDPEQAEQLYRQLAEQNPNDAIAQIGLARVLLAQDRCEASREILEQLEKRGFLEPEAEKLKATLQLQADGGGDLEQLRQAAREQPQDLQRQLELAQGLARQQQYEEALETCLAIVRSTKVGVGEQARQLMVQIFHVLPDDSELVRTYRRQLSTALY